jgi:hypothetical protein
MIEQQEILINDAAEFGNSDAIEQTGTPDRPAEAQLSYAPSYPAGAVAPEAQRPYAPSYSAGAVPPEAQRSYAPSYPEAVGPSGASAASREPLSHAGRAASRRTPLGSLVAVAGLCGGAGATTLAYLVGRYAREALAMPVLVCDTGGPSGALATYSGVEVPRSLPRIANAVAAHEPLAGGLFADDGSGLRVIASRPQLDSQVDERGVARVLCDARGAHAVTVVDCGTLTMPIARHVLDAATHVAWVMPATAAALARVVGVLDLYGIDGSRREMLVARGDPAERKPPMEQLSALAERRGAPLVLMPSVPDLASRPVDEALEATALTLDAIHMVISQ